LKTQLWDIKIIFSSLINLFIIIKASSFNFRIILIDSFLENKYIVYVGKVSYGIYLYHGIIGKFIRDKVFNPFWDSIPFDKLHIFSFLKHWDWVFRLSSIAIGSVIVASISFYFFEKQFIKLKNRYFT
jgi:peptidoglycan/LPS O-acetylase OafA/YrhL